MSVLLFEGALPPVDTREVLRYMKSGTPTPEVTALLEGTLHEVEPLLTPRLCYRTVEVKHTGTGVEIGGFLLASVQLARALSGCTKAIVFAATAGLALDRTIARYGRVSPARALAAQGIGTERTEALCDAFVKEQNAMLAQKGMRLRPRFSPGYGDLSLTAQHALFALLSPEKHIGVTLTKDLLMSPTKSVTAIAGIEVIT